MALLPVEAEAQYWDDVIQKTTLIPVGQEEFFRRLWRNGRLRYKGDQLRVGAIEELSARMLATTVRRRRSLFVVLPESRPENAPALFGTLLLIDAVDKLTDPGSRSNRVLLFGSGVAIRAHLSYTTVHGLSLSSVFRQLHLQQDARRIQSPSEVDAQLSASLPQVVCSLSPAKPRDVLDRFRPTWIAVDCDSDHIDWLGSVIDGARDRGIPIVGWISGYPTTVPAVLREHRIPVFSWPPMQPVVASGGSIRGFSGRRLAEDSAHPIFLPLVLQGGLSESTAERLDRTRSMLLNLACGTRGQLIDDCLRAGWRCVRGIENLHVPLRFHDVECKQFWGMSPVGARHATYERFVEAVKTQLPEGEQRLSDSVRPLRDSLDELAAGEPPLWAALLKICVADATPRNPRCVVFSSAARRKLFELALIAFEGISVTDLLTVGVTVSSLTDLNAQWPAIDKDRDEIDTRPTAAPIQRLGCVYLIGWPAVERLRRLEPLFAAEQIRVIGLPHQESDIRRNIRRVADSCVVRSAEDTSALSGLGVSIAISGAPQEFSYVGSLPTEHLDVTGLAHEGTVLERNPLWTAPDATKEAQWLLQDDEGDSDDSAAISEPGEDGEDIHGMALSDEGLTLELVVRVEVTDGRRVLFAPDGNVNVIRGSTLYESMRPVRADAIRPGDRIIFIHGQRRQSLYDLLIDRVHTHPSIRLHLALIRAWHDELRRAFRDWSIGRVAAYDDLLERLQALGCRRTAALTIRFWVRGVIICPSDPDDLRRVAQVMDIPFVREHYLRISKAADRLRGLHRGLANRLGNWIRAQAAGGSPASDEDVFDQELGLTLTDFRESLEVLVVRSSTEQQGLFLRSSLNRISERKLP